MVTYAVFRARQTWGQIPAPSITARVTLSHLLTSLSPTVLTHKTKIIAPVIVVLRQCCPAEIHWEPQIQAMDAKFSRGYLKISEKETGEISFNSFFFIAPSRQEIAFQHIINVVTISPMLLKRDCIIFLSHYCWIQCACYTYKPIQLTLDTFQVHDSHTCRTLRLWELNEISQHEPRHGINSGHCDCH